MKKLLSGCWDLIATVDRDHARSPGIFLVVKKADLVILWPILPEEPRCEGFPRCGNCGTATYLPFRTNPVLHFWWQHHVAVSR